MLAIDGWVSAAIASVGGFAGITFIKGVVQFMHDRRLEKKQDAQHAELMEKLDGIAEAIWRRP